MRTVIAILFLVECFHCDERQRITEMIKTDSQFNDDFIDLIQLQDRQWYEQKGDTSLRELTNILNKCGPPEGVSADHADNLRPSDIFFYAEIGYLSRFCKHNITELKNGILDPCDYPASTQSLPSIDKFLRIFNPEIKVIVSPADKRLTAQGSFIVKEIKKHDSWNDKWKLIAIMPGLQDGEAVDRRQVAIEVLAVITELNITLGERTMIVVVRNSGASIWADSANTHKACRKMLDRYKDMANINSDMVWNQVEKITKANFRRELFSVQMLPLLNEASLVNLTEGIMDLSIMGYDCAHFSAKGLSMFHIAVWNSLLTQTSERTHKYRPIVTNPQCTDPQCPFIRTHNNSALCMWAIPKDEHDSRLIEQWIAISALITAIALCILLIIVICCDRGRERILKLDSDGLKPVGADWSSITKFIDEDSYSTLTSHSKVDI